MGRATAMFLYKVCNARQYCLRPWLRLPVRRCFHHNHHVSLRIEPGVRLALEEGRPVVALESTIISHGMPYPENLTMARQETGIPLMHHVHVSRLRAKRTIATAGRIIRYHPPLLVDFQNLGYKYISNSHNDRECSLFAPKSAAVLEAFISSRAF